jgi:hypothetical protein
VPSARAAVPEKYSTANMIAAIAIARIEIPSSLVRPPIKHKS